MVRTEPVWIAIQVTESLSADMITSPVDADSTEFNVVQPQCQTSASMVCSVFIMCTGVVILNSACNIALLYNISTFAWQATGTSQLKCFS